MVGASRFGLFGDEQVWIACAGTFSPDSASWTNYVINYSLYSTI